MRRPRLQFRLSTLLWIVAVVAGFFGGMVVGESRAKRGLCVFHDDFADVVLDEYGDGRMIVTELDKAGNRVTVEMSIQGDTRRATMPSGKIVKHRPNARRVTELRTPPARLPAPPPTE